MFAAVVALKSPCLLLVGFTTRPNSELQGVSRTTHLPAWAPHMRTLPPGVYGKSRLQHGQHGLSELTELGHHCYAATADDVAKLQKAFVDALAETHVRANKSHTCLGGFAGLHGLYNEIHYAHPDKNLGMLAAARAIFYVNATGTRLLGASGRVPRRSAEYERLALEASRAAVRAHSVAVYLRERVRWATSTELPILQFQPPCTTAHDWQQKSTPWSNAGSDARLGDSANFFLRLPPHSMPAPRPPGRGAHRLPLAWNTSEEMTCACKGCGAEGTSEGAKSHCGMLGNHELKAQLWSITKSIEARRRFHSKNPKRGNHSHPGELSHATCRRMMRTPGHVFQQMWAARGWDVMRPSEKPCWADPQSANASATRRALYAEEVAAGTNCKMSWSSRQRGALRRIHTSASSGPFAAVIGLMHDVSRLCKVRPGNPAAKTCRAMGLHVLSRRDGSTPYNMCHNFEWLVCAAKGMLEHQVEGAFSIATSPKYLDLDEHPLGHCRGSTFPVAPRQGSRAAFGYTARDVYAFEICALSEICSNGHELFDGRRKHAGRAGDRTHVNFSCNFSADGLGRLSELLFRQPDEYDEMPCHRNVHMSAVTQKYGTFSSKAVAASSIVKSIDR